MDFELTSALKSLQARARRFVEEELIPRELQVEEHGALPSETQRGIQKRAIEERLWPMNVPKEMGGLGSTVLEQVIAHGDRMDLIVAVGLEQPACVSAVGFVAKHVRPGGMGREQDDPVAESLKLPAPVVSRATSFEEDGSGLSLGAELEEGGPGQPLVLADLAGSNRHRHLENFLRHIDGDGGRLHGGLLSLLKSSSGLKVTQKRTRSSAQRMTGCSGPASRRIEPGSRQLSAR